MLCPLWRAHCIPTNRTAFTAEFAERAENHNRGNLNSNSCLYWALMSLLPYGIALIVGIAVTLSRWFRFRRTQESVIGLMYWLVMLIFIGVMWIVWKVDQVDVSESCKTTLSLVHFVILLICWTYLGRIDRRDRRL